MKLIYYCLDRNWFTIENTRFSPVKDTRFLSDRLLNSKFYNLYDAIISNNKVEMLMPWEIIDFYQKAKINKVVSENKIRKILSHSEFVSCYVEKFDSLAWRIVRALGKSGFCCFVFNDKKLTLKFYNKKFYSDKFPCFHTPEEFLEYYILKKYEETERLRSFLNHLDDEATRFIFSDWLEENFDDQTTGIFLKMIK